MKQAYMVWHNVDLDEYEIYNREYDLISTDKEEAKEALTVEDWKDDWESYQSPKTGIEGIAVWFILGGRS